MILKDFRKIVDQTTARITAYRNDAQAQYEYVGLTFQRPYQSKAVTDALYGRIANSFTTGHAEARRTVRNLKIDLIREHVIQGVPLDPYFEVLSHLEDALRPGPGISGEVVGDWTSAIQAAQDHIEMSNFRTVHHKQIYSREFAVAEAAKFLQQRGYDVRLEPSFIALEESSEKSLIKKIEKLIVQLGAIDVIAKIFAEITPLYDTHLQRYHLVPHMSALGGGTPQIPWGYLLQLAVKNVDARSEYRDFDRYWPELLSLVTAFAALVDVQPYYPPMLRNFDSSDLIEFLREQALYDSLFRFSQLRSSDVLKLCKGALSFLDFDEPSPAGWTLNDAFEVVGHLNAPNRDARGSVIFSEHEVIQALPHISSDNIAKLLREVFAHPVVGPNQKFSRPTDAPTPDDKLKGADFYLKPLIRRPSDQYLLVDRSVCGWGYLESLLTALRPHHKQFDDKVGLAIESFLREELHSHGVPTVSGDYDVPGAHGQCDIVPETPETVFFMELKKKSLTRRARAGVDVDLLLDLAGSLLDALAQAGWHEVRLTKYGSLDLAYDGTRQTLSLGGRGIEKIAVGMMDFGSFQDRAMLMKFMEGTLNLNFGARDPLYEKKFRLINDALEEIRDQYNATYERDAEIRQPFFNCWFLSIPQLLVILDGVTDVKSFRDALWICRHITTGTSDLYFEISKTRLQGAASQASA